MKKLFFGIGFITFILLACGKDNPPPVTTGKTDTVKNNNGDTTGGGGGDSNNHPAYILPVPGVYIAGDSFDLSTQYAPYPVYWVNGKQVHLPNATHAGASGIVVSDSNVYISCDGIYFGNNVTYWKNTTGINLTDPTITPPSTTGITLFGNDLYIVGNAYINNYEKLVPIYWKNGGKAIKIATYSSSPADGHAITVSGNDIYIAGSGADPVNYGLPPCYWKNGTPTFLHSVSPSNGSGLAKSIFVSGTDIYVVGEVYPIGSGSQIGWAVYWKNGIATELTPPSKFAQANCVTVVGSDVYIAGAVTGTDNVLHATYWKNGVPVTLDPKYSVANAIAVSGVDVYVAGNRSVDTALYWKNGIPVILGRGRANAIAIKK